MKLTLIALILGASPIEYSVFSFCCNMVFYQIINEKPLSKRLDKTKGEKRK